MTLNMYVTNRLKQLAEEQRWKQVTQMSNRGSEKHIQYRRKSTNISEFQIRQTHK